MLFAVFYQGQRTTSPLTMILVMAFALIPVAGVADQALAAHDQPVRSPSASLVGSLVNVVSHAFFPDPPQAAAAQQRGAPAASTQDRRAGSRSRATLIVMPVFVLALTNPSLYLAAIMKTVALGQQAGETNARSAGRRAGRFDPDGRLRSASSPGCGLSLLPILWMLDALVDGGRALAGSAMFGARRTRSRALVLEQRADHDVDPARARHRGQRERQERARRHPPCARRLFIGVSLYAWGTVWALEHWRGSRTAGDERQRRHTLEAIA